MSNTYKDRPYWVKLNDLERYQFKGRCHHELFGKTVKKYQAIVETKTVEKQVETQYTETVRINDYAYKSLKKNGIKNVTVTEEIVTYEQVDSGKTHAETCTYYKIYKNRNDYRGKEEAYSENYETCGRWLKNPKWNRPINAQRKIYNAGQRRAKNQYNVNLAKAYNSGTDLEEIDVYEPRTRLHYGWWD